MHGPPRSRAKSHPTAAPKIEGTALTNQSDMRPGPSATLPKRRAQGPTSKRSSSPIALTQGRLDRQKRHRRFTLTCHRAGARHSPDIEQCTASLCGVRLSCGQFLERTSFAQHSRLLCIWPSRWRAGYWRPRNPAIDQVEHDLDSSAWPATLQRPVDLPEASLNPDCAAHHPHRRMNRFDMG